LNDAKKRHHTTTGRKIPRENFEKWLMSTTGKRAYLFSCPFYLGIMVFCARLTKIDFETSITSSQPRQMGIQIMSPIIFVVIWCWYYHSCL
jgi:hypothetical protein